LTGRGSSRFLVSLSVCPNVLRLRSSVELQATFSNPTCRMSNCHLSTHRYSVWPRYTNYLCLRWRHVSRHVLIDVSHEQLSPVNSQIYDHDTRITCVSGDVTYHVTFWPITCVSGDVTYYVTFWPTEFHSCNAGLSKREARLRSLWRASKRYCAERNKDWRFGILTC
jgi:hypothetical protein